MKKLGFGLLLAAVIGMTCSSLGFAGVRVAVMDFENQSPHGGWKLGKGAADILTTEMVKIGKFDMFERGKLNSVMQEQNLGASGRIDPSTAAQIGKIVGVGYIITGAITEYGQSSGGGGGRGFNLSKKGYHTSVDIRIVDATTGQIVFADSGSHSKSSVNVKVFGIGGGERFNDKLATETMREAIKKVASQIAQLDLKASKMVKAPKTAGTSASSGGKALVADIDGNLITLNKGSNAGFKKGQTIVISRVRKVIKDPNTGKVIRVKYKEVGTITLTDVGTSYAEGSIVSGNDMKIGDMVK